MARPSPPRKLLSHFTLDTDAGLFLGGTRIRLLEAIDAHGSITAAAKTIPLSYKAAWDAVDDMNNLADAPLVARTVGGAHGGGTRLTDHGRRMVAFFRALEQTQQQILDQAAQALGEGGAQDVARFRGLIHRLAMKTSARNAFAGPVSALRAGAVSVEVCLRIDVENELTALITRDSAEHLQLALGQEVHAFVKAPSVLLCTDPALRINTRNQLWGSVERLTAGPVNTEVVLRLASGRSVVATITSASVQQLELAPGTRAAALIPESSVMLATFD